MSSSLFLFARGKCQRFLDFEKEILYEIITSDIYHSYLACLSLEIFRNDVFLTRAMILVDFVVS